MAFDRPQELDIRSVPACLFVKTLEERKLSIDLRTGVFDVLGGYQPLLQEGLDGA